MPALSERKPGQRKQQILEALASALENHPGDRITTAALARAAGVSEAALYRHFASKARMFEGLIDYSEGVIFERINSIVQHSDDIQEQCFNIVYLLLGFAGRNPGITRVLMGEALTGEKDRLLLRVEQFFARIETELRQLLKASGLRGQHDQLGQTAAAANLLISHVEGRLHQFLRSQFRNDPLSHWEEQRQMLRRAIF